MICSRYTQCAYLAYYRSSCYATMHIHLECHKYNIFCSHIILPSYAHNNNPKMPHAYLDRLCVILSAICWLKLNITWGIFSFNQQIADSVTYGGVGKRKSFFTALASQYYCWLEQPCPAVSSPAVRKIQHR